LTGTLRPAARHGGHRKGRLTLVAVILDRDEVKRLLEHLRLFTEPIPMKSARDPPELWTKAYDFA
jgi:hypothetical protein